ncbi:hypothetical protein RND81_13G054900 [Saponaria officinalis]|uniref:Uncharacterized protein n=1 Tax=Saponaria officinalis TaxID=3572 RepID=A0AAW1GYV2_SAPOF
MKKSKKKKRRSKKKKVKLEEVENVMVADSDEDEEKLEIVDDDDVAEDDEEEKPFYFVHVEFHFRCDPPCIHKIEAALKDSRSSKFGYFILFIVFGLPHTIVFDLCFFN